MLKSSIKNWNKHLGNHHDYISSKLANQIEDIQDQLMFNHRNDALWMQE